MRKRLEMLLRIARNVREEAKTNNPSTRRGKDQVIILDGAVDQIYRALLIQSEMEVIAHV